MNRFLILIFAVFFVGCAVQKSKLIGVFNLIETAKFDDAKKAVEEMIEDEKMSQWPRTWYARGVLCQTAYQDGIKKNDRKKYELYDDQLYVAYDSYEKALSLDRKGSLEKQLAPRYVLLANDFREMGRKHYTGEKYKEALRAFEKALQITQAPFLALQTDTNLIYNAALAAIGSRDHDAAISYLGRLDGYSYSPNVSHLLYSEYLVAGDTLSAEKVLARGIDQYEENEHLVLLLADLLFNIDSVEKALSILDKAAENEPEKHVFPFTKGLVYQKTEQYIKAIGAYEAAAGLAPEETIIYVNIATCYYNIGVEIEEYARTLNNNREVLEEKTRSASAFESASAWLEKAFDRETTNQAVLVSIYQLARLLNMTERANSLEGRINSAFNK